MAQCTGLVNGAPKGRSWDMSKGRAAHSPGENAPGGNGYVNPDYGVGASTCHRDKVVSQEDAVDDHQVQRQRHDDLQEQKDELRVDNELHRASHPEEPMLDLVSFPCVRIKP